MKKTEHDHQVQPGGQLEKELELEFGAFTRAGPADDREIEELLLPPASPQKKRPLPRLVTRARAADLFERFFGRRTYVGGRIYS